LKKTANFIKANGIFIGLVLLVPGVSVIFSPYTQSNVYLIKTVLLQSAVFALLIFWLARAFLAKESLHPIPLLTPLLVILALGIFSLLLSPYRYAVWEEFLRFLSFFIFYFLIVEEIKDERRETWLIEILVLTAILVSAYGIIQYLGFPIFKWVPREKRVMSFLGNPNFFATYLVAIIPLLLVLSLQWTRRRKFIAGISLLSALACLVFTGTRSAWIGFVFSLIFLSVLAKRAKAVAFSLRKAIIPLAVLAGIVLLLILHHHMISSRISEIGAPHGAVSQRWHIWKVTWNMIKSSPIIGSGLGTFPIIFPRFRYPNYGLDIPYGNLQHAHNEYLEIWSEMGLIGLGIFLWFIIGFFFHAIRYLRGRKEKGMVMTGLLSGIMGVLIDSFFSTSMRFTGPPFVFWLLIGLSVAMTMPKVTPTIPEIKKPRSKLTQIAVISAAVICSALIARWHINKYQANVHLAKAQNFIDNHLRINAISELKEALEHNPHEVLSIYLLGCLNVEIENFNQAKKWFEKLEKLAPDFSNIHEWKGYLFYRLGDLPIAEKEFALCTQLQASVFDHNMLGNIYSLQGKWDQAIEELEQVDRLGTAAEKARPSQSAPPSSNEFLDQSPETEPARGGTFPQSLDEDEMAKTKIMLAHAYYETGKLVKAIPKMDEISVETLSEKQRDVLAQLYLNIAQKYIEGEGDLDQALQLCRRALSLDSSHPELIHDTQAWIYYKKGNLKEAKQEMEKALAIAPDSISFQRHLIMIDKAGKGK
jgi:O-antigen ligase/tetratricopeptide (TPR) repeat protein